jgi:hypothetical protein
LRAQVEEAVIAAGMKTAPWLRARVRQITLMDVSASG